MSGIKNVQARISTELYQEVQAVIKEYNRNPDNEEKISLQKVVVEALREWVRKHQRKEDSLLALDGLVDSSKEG